MTFRKPLVASVAVAALMLSPIASIAQETTTEAPAAEAAPTEDSATEGVAAAVDELASQNWLKVCDPLPDGQMASSSVRSCCVMILVRKAACWRWLLCRLAFCFRLG
jgi:hypothetical protein